MGFFKYKAGHRKGYGKEAEGYAIVVSQESFSGQALDEIVANGMENVGARGSL